MRTDRAPSPIRRAARIVPCALLLVFAACRGDRAPAAEPPPLVGRWQGTYDQVEFFRGGRLLLKRGPTRGTGRYEFVEPRRVLMTYEGLLAGSYPGDYAVEVQGDRLRLCETELPSRCIRYVRVTEPGPAPPPTRPMLPGVPRLAEAPRGPLSPAEARVVESHPVLKQAYTLQSVYRTERGAYAPVMDSLRVVGWETPGHLRYYHPPRVTRSTGRLCIVMEPRDADLWPMHIDEEGDLGRGRACN